MYGYRAPTYHIHQNLRKAVVLHRHRGKCVRGEPHKMSVTLDLRKAVTRKAKWLIFLTKPFSPVGCVSFGKSNIFLPKYDDFRHLNEKGRRISLKRQKSPYFGRKMLLLPKQHFTMLGLKSNIFKL